MGVNLASLAGETKKRFDTYSPLPVDSASPQRRKLSTFTVVIPLTFLCFLIIIWFQLPKVTTLPITLRYPRCGHIVLVSERRHGSTWFISNAENCVSVNGSYGDLNKNIELWHHGNVKKIAVQDAIDTVRFKSSVKLFPTALYEHGDELRAFLESMRDLQVPVFVLRRDLYQVFASLQAAGKSSVWNVDHGGVVVEREVQDKKAIKWFKNRTESYFDNMKTMMNDIGIIWDEIEYETILSQRLIVGESVKCYVRNCNFS